MEIIAFYLPQYHPTPHNNEWWGEGFTEWTNVAKAKPLFPGHYQPKIPADLGFYDLRMPEVKEKQALLAKEAGITGFCYYHYWFGNGQQELELPFNQVVESGKPNFPFCLCWANESWYRKFWNKDGNVADKQDLAIQTYPGADDNIKHFLSLKKAFSDNRYIRINGKLLFVIYKPLLFEGVEDFMAQWRSLAKEHGLGDFFFAAYTTDISNDRTRIEKLGFDSIISCRIRRYKKRGVKWLTRKIISYLTNTPERYNYKKVYPTLIGEEEKQENIYPTLVPNWDHTPRSGNHGYLFTNSTPELFEKHVENVLYEVKRKERNNQICFLKSWNEWGEGNYVEPDLKYGKGYLNAIKTAIKKVYHNENPADK